MYKCRPGPGYLLLKKHQPLSVLASIDADPKADEVFEILDIGILEKDDPKVHIGDLIALVGYLNTVKIQGETFLIARVKDVICKLTLNIVGG